MSKAAKAPKPLATNVFYKPNFLKLGDSAGALMFNDMPWEDRTEARRECFFSLRDEPYTYGTGAGERTYIPVPADHPTPAREFINWVRARVTMHFFPDLADSDKPPFEACFVNGYADKKQALGWHADDSEAINHDHPIVVVSLGSWREIWWREKSEDNSGFIFTEKLQNGSMFYMPPGMQQTHEHRIPRADSERGPRISMTFRSLK